MKIYTRKGDGGQTQLFSGRRTSKADACIVATGDLDELTASLGLANLAFPSAAEQLRKVQHNLYLISAIVSAEGKRPELAFSAAETSALESRIDEISEQLPPLRDFIYPGESEASARLHMARAIARRAERNVAALEAPAAPQAILSYLNRLSDFLFVLARQADLGVGNQDRALKD